MLLCHTKAMAHLLGHQIGIFHDFESKGESMTNRYSKHGHICTLKNGIMDYYYHPQSNTKWTECSAEDFEDFFRNTVKEDGKFCMNTIKPCM